jgi:hypothetical protein
MCGSTATGWVYAGVQDGGRWADARSSRIWARTRRSRRSASAPRASSACARSSRSPNRRRAPHGRSTSRSSTTRCARRPRRSPALTSPPQLLIMHAGCQERYKHSVPPARALDGAYACRINITFRFFRPDFAPARVPRCACGVPAVLRPDAKLRAGAMRYWWACGGQDGPGCGLWKVMDVRAEGRGPFAMDVQTEREGPREAGTDEEGERSGEWERATNLQSEEELDGPDQIKVAV